MASWEHTKKAIGRGNIVLPLPSSVTDWEDEVKKLPRITYASIFSYIIGAVDSDGEAMNNLKSAEAYQYLHSNKVGPVLIKSVGHDMVYLKADVEPSQTLTVPHHQAWVLAQMSGEVQTAGCSCIAGPGRTGRYSELFPSSLPKLWTILQDSTFYSQFHLYCSILLLCPFFMSD